MESLCIQLSNNVYIKILKNWPLWLVLWSMVTYEMCYFLPPKVCLYLVEKGKQNISKIKFIVSSLLFVYVLSLCKVRVKPVSSFNSNGMWCGCTWGIMVKRMNLGCTGSEVILSGRSNCVRYCMLPLLAQKKGLLMCLWCDVSGYLSALDPRSTPPVGFDVFFSQPPLWSPSMNSLPCCT